MFEVTEKARSMIKNFLGKQILIVMILGYLFLTMTFSGSVVPAYGADKSVVPSYGDGTYEVLIFTDYFCPPCQSLEKDLDLLLEALLTGGSVKVTFVDMPIHKPTVMYARYFLYAANGSSGYKDITHVRKSLFTLAQQNTAITEEYLKEALNAQGIVLKPYDVKPVFSEYNSIIRKYKVTSTPTCIVKYSESDVRRYQGFDEIRNGLSELQTVQK
jgi:protein-disulfide isomerase